jgi:D-methionine transport system permease protein
MSMTWERLGSMLLEETGNTLLMTLPATFFAYLIGLPLGVLLVITRKDGILPKPTLNRIIGVIVNLLRSVPFIILMVMLFPATRAILGRGTGTVSIIIPLTVSAFPYVARMVEGSLLEVDNGVVEAAQAMGSTTFQIVRKVLIPEAMPSLVNGFAICITTILGYTAMAGTGGDGLGKVAITYGLNKRQYDVMYAASIVLVLLVQFFQMGGTWLSHAIDHRRRK